MRTQRIDKLVIYMNGTGASHSKKIPDDGLRTASAAQSAAGLLFANGADGNGVIFRFRNRIWLEAKLVENKEICAAFLEEKQNKDTVFVVFDI